MRKDVRKNKGGKWGRLCVLLLAAVLTVSLPGTALAQAESGSAPAAEETEKAADLPLTAQEKESAEALPETGSHNRGSQGGGKKDSEKRESGSLSVSGYEIEDTGGSGNPMDTVRKGRQVRVTVYVKGNGIRTGDVKKGDISVSKSRDSFQNGDTPKVKITSGKDDNLEYAVTFSKITYRGKGNSLKFRTSFKGNDIPSETLETIIEECEETSRGDSGESDTAGQPVIQIKRTAPQTPVGPGEKFTLELNFKNTSSDADIEDLVVSVSPGNSIFIGDDTNSGIISRLDTRKSASIKLNMIAGAELSGPTQAIELELKYNYYSGGSLTAGTSSQKVLIPIRGGSASGQPVIRIGRSGIGKSVNANEPFELIVKLENTSTDRDIRNLVATFDSNEQISLQEDTDTRQLGDLRAGQSVEVPLHLKAGAELSAAASQLLGVSLKFDYDSDKGPVQGTYGEKLVIPTNGQERGPGAPAPNVIVANYTYGERVTAGQVFDLNLEFMNTSQTLPVENVVMSLDTGEGISINSASNTFYIPKLGPGGKERVKVQVQALFQSKLQSPKLSISGKYEYVEKKERKQLSASETIAIPVYQPDRFQVKEPEFTETIHQGEETTISIPYVNKGRGQVFNVEAKLEGEIAAVEKDLNLGNYEAGKSGTIDFVVTPSGMGEFKGQVTVAYEDEAMEVKTLTVPVTFQVEAGVSDSEGDLEEPAEEKNLGAGKWAGIFLAAAVFILTAIIVKLKNVKQKKRKSAEEPEEVWESEEEL